MDTADRSQQSTACCFQQGWKVMTIRVSDGAFSLTSLFRRHFFLPSSSTIKIYSTDTLKVVSTLSSLTVRSASTSSTPSDSHTGIVTAVLLNPNNPLQLYSASQDGTIKIWDWLEGVLLKSITYGAPITHMCAHAGLPDVAFVAATKEKPARTAKGEYPLGCRRRFFVSRPTIRRIESQLRHRARLSQNKCDIFLRHPRETQQHRENRYHQTHYRSLRLPLWILARCYLRADSPCLFHDRPQEGILQIRFALHRCAYMSRLPPFARLLRHRRR